jgi:hypothetical protein
MSPARDVGGTVSLDRIEGKMGEREEGLRSGFEPTTLSPKTTAHSSTTPSPCQRSAPSLTTQVEECDEFLSGSLAQVSPQLDHSGILSSAQEFSHMTVCRTHLARLCVFLRGWRCSTVSALETLGGLRGPTYALGP